MALTKQDFQEIQKIVKGTIDYSFEHEFKKSIKETVEDSFEHSFKKTVKDIVSKEVESLAIITNKTFIVMEKRFEKIDKSFEKIDQRFEKIDLRFDANDSAHRSINARLDLIETDLSNLRNLVHEVQQIRKMLENTPTKDEVGIIHKRLLRVEKHLGLNKINT